MNFYIEDTHKMHKRLIKKIFIIFIILFKLEKINAEENSKILQEIINICFNKYSKEENQNNPIECIKKEIEFNEYEIEDFKQNLNQKNNFMQNEDYLKFSIEEISKKIEIYKNLKEMEEEELLDFIIEQQKQEIEKRSKYLKKFCCSVFTYVIFCYICEKL